ncbi:MAG TPA: 4Fe-4S dicluster domain-containing protein [Rhodanobacteraceae bacterium]
MSNDHASQQPCIHCGACATVCPETLDPDALFAALTHDDWPAAQAARLDACTLCERCVAVCPSHIPLVDWFRWGQSETRWRDSAQTARTRFAARTARLDRERDERAARRRVATPRAGAALPSQRISHAEVLAAIARGRAKRARPHTATQPGCDRET